MILTSNKLTSNLNDSLFDISSHLSFQKKYFALIRIHQVLIVILKLTLNKHTTKKIITLCFMAATIISCNQTNEKTVANQVLADQVKETTMDADTTIANLKINPISHATMVLEWDGITIYVDPVGGEAAFSNFDSPDLILITDIHGDHMEVVTVEGVAIDKTIIIAPEAVAQNFSEEFKAMTTILSNKKTAKKLKGFTVEAIPMYNLRPEALKFHQKGRGNGYVIEHLGKRVYISGDTEDIPEMRALQNIDAAFVCMNLPYTMTVENAASAVIEFAPKKVYPYHYRGTEGLSDVAAFKSMVNKGNPDVEVVQLGWYAE